MTIRWGICGCGHIAKRMATAIGQVPGCRLQAVAARDPQRAQAFAADYGNPIVHASYQELIDDPTVDVVYIATVHNRHYPMLCQALAGGKAVVCEKPLVISEDQARAVVALARSHQRLLIEAMWIRFQPAIRQLHEVIASGQLGTLTQVRCDFSVGGGGKRDPLGRKLDPGQAGGAMLDLGIYPLAMAQDFLGPITDISGFAELGETGVDENHAYITRHAGGGLGVGTVGLRGVGTLVMEVCGSEARATTGRAWPPTEIALHRGWEPEPYAFLRDTSGVDGFVYTVQETMQCLNDGLIESPRMTHAQSIELARYIEQCWRRAGVVYRTDDICA